jgi:nitroimidazol reductase NimA-like FMN-containing flavoprotein (pyridoxamine 5'-phosphate oxidase superfamily)
MMRRRAAASFALAALLLQSYAVAESPAFPADFVARLDQVKEVYVGTQRKDGSRSSVVPVWFAYLDGAIWFASKPSSRKVKRVKKGSPMYVSASGSEGPIVRVASSFIAHHRSIVLLY